MVLIASLIVLASTILFCIALRVVAQPLFDDFESSQHEAESVDDEQPSAAVILCVRGADPTLQVCLEGLLTQDYRDYEVHVVLDSDADPAAKLVRNSISNHSFEKVTVHILRDPDSRRGLKVSAILQALTSLSDDVEAVAFLDADAEPDRFWLRNLMRPLGDPGVGATSGLRWFAPATRNAGSLIRAKWNLYALVLMKRCNIAWGGSLAIRRDTLTSTDLPRK